MSRRGNFKYSNYDSNVKHLQYLEVEGRIVSNRFQQDGKCAVVRLSKEIFISHESGSFVTSFDDHI